MPDIQGVVEKYNVKSGVGRNGKPYALYSVKVNGEFYSNGFNPITPEPKPGDMVKVRYDEVQNGQYTNRNIKLFRIEQEGNGSVEGAGNSSSGVVANQGNGMAWGNASNVAANLIAQLVLADALPLTEAKGKANKAKRMEEFLECYDKLRVKLYKDSQNIDRVLEQHADFGEVETNDPPAIPEAAVEEFDEEENFAEDDLDF